MCTVQYWIVWDRSSLFVGRLYDIISSDACLVGVDTRTV